MNFLRGYGPGILRGFATQAAPSIAQGALIELLRHQGITVGIISEWVQRNRSLWKQISPEDRKHIKDLVSQVNDVNWLTSEWAIEAVRKDLPAIASLFLGWTKARNWLDRQIEELKRELVV
jgi:hypothetical protein